MEEKQQNKMNNLKNFINQFDKVAVAFSGGVDSTFLLKICSDLLDENCIAITLNTPAHTIKEIEQSKKFTDSLNIPHLIIDIDVNEIPEFNDNTKMRCYYCKKYMFSKIKDMAGLENISHVFDGSNYDDVKDYRPGMKAIKELEVVSPLIHAKLCKKEIRKISKQMNLSSWDKPANPCLASRIPYGDKITKTKLKQIEKAEIILHSMGFENARVRHHNTLARIEVENDKISLIINNKSEIIRKFKDIGFSYITLDLQGYRMGSLNEVL